MLLYTIVVDFHDGDNHKSITRGKVLKDAKSLVDALAIM